VKILRADDQFIFQLGRREKQSFSELLKLYPQIPSAHRYSKGTAPVPETSRRLLDEALAEQRTANQQRVQKFLAEPRRFQESQAGWRLSLTPPEMEWLLQILNDIRVGSWILLGAPEEKFELKLLNEQTAPHFWAMETAGHFQMQLLSALQR
jgi:hypothetical protein